MPSPHPNVDEYLAALQPGPRKALQQLRQALRAAAPDAEECMSYGIPALRQGRLLVGFGATKHHLALYAMSGTALGALEHDLTGYDVSKGTVRFDWSKPLPKRLVRELVALRLEENAAPGGTKTERASKTIARKASKKTSKRTSKRAC